ncbi:cadherin-7-like isoform X1 [Lates japonicus]|uniref:Cadherin-7-like isoform X1 n=1 Tax=Lates japonicus TaxID=270547 RepID=A0AAD3M7M5_LATJO|nr:cadherin-7-like isoform X1 [Lates japonicus]
MLSSFVLLLWEESGCEAMTLNSVLLPQLSGEGLGGGTARRGVVSQQRRGRRRRRSWVWNQFFVLEEYTGDELLYVGKLHSDVDKGDGQVRYVLNGEGAMSIFTIDENTGDIHATKRLDREQQAYYTLRAQARDRNTNLPVEPESQFIIKVQDINDNEPKFLDGPYMARVSERSPVGTSVVTVVATDADDPTYGNSARLVYSILQGQPYFSVEPTTGVVRIAPPDLDRAAGLHLLVNQAKDMVGQMGGLVTVQCSRVCLVGCGREIKALDLDVGPNAEMDYSRILDGDGLGTFRISLIQTHRKDCHPDKTDARRLPAAARVAAAGGRLSTARHRCRPHLCQPWNTRHQTPEEEPDGGFMNVDARVAMTESVTKDIYFDSPCNPDVTDEAWSEISELAHGPSYQYCAVTVSLGDGVCAGPCGSLLVCLTCWSLQSSDRLGGGSGAADLVEEIRRPSTSSRRLSRDKEGASFVFTLHLTRTKTMTLRLVPTAQSQTSANYIQTLPVPVQDELLSKKKKEKKKVSSRPVEMSFSASARAPDSAASSGLRFLVQVFLTNGFRTDLIGSRTSSSEAQHLALTLSIKTCL